MTSVDLVLLICGGFLLFQLLAVVPFVLRLRQPTGPQPVVDAWPKFFVVMPLRGADETLEAALQCLLAQDYPDFEVRIVVDHETDPAWKVLQRVIAESKTTRLQPTTLRVRRESCSLLCSCLNQVLEDLRGREGLLSFCAADMHPPRNWLREMATLMADPTVGTTLGNRWYLPPRGQWGSLIQWLWNVGAIVPMAVQQIPWGGALALRLSDIRAAKLDEKWHHGMVEDAPIKAAMKELGLKFRFSPQLFVADRGEITFARAAQFIYRQLLWTRLYHPSWWLVVANAVFMTAVMLLPFIAALIAVAIGELATAQQMLGIGIAYVLGSAILAWGLDVAVRRVLRDRGEDAESFSIWTWCRLCLAIPVTQVVYAIAMVFAGFTREVSWRGIRYRLDGPWSIKMLGYRPYLATQESSDEASSSLSAEQVNSDVPINT